MIKINDFRFQVIKDSLYNNVRMTFKYYLAFYRTKTITARGIPLGVGLKTVLRIPHAM